MLRCRRVASRLAQGARQGRPSVAPARNAALVGRPRGRQRCANADCRTVRLGPQPRPRQGQLRPRIGARRLHASRPPRSLHDRRPDKPRPSPPAWPKSRCNRDRWRARRFAVGSKAMTARFTSSTSTSAPWPRSVGSAPVVEFKGLRLSSPANVALVHLVFLTGFRNRLGALIRRAGALLGRHREERAFTMRRATAGDDRYASVLPSPIDHDRPG